MFAKQVSKPKNTYGYYLETELEQIIRLIAKREHISKSSVLSQILYQSPAIKEELERRENESPGISKETQYRDQ